MKKLLVLALTFVLCACGGPKVTKADTEYVFTDYTSGSEQKVLVSVELEDGKISKIEIDETYTKDGQATTKRTLGADYGMKGVSASKGVIPNGGEWFEQIDHLQTTLIGTDGTIALDEAGYPTDEDVKAGCTIYLGVIAEAVKDAVSKAQ